jgi:NADPH-dependent 2,4-dienoyl-CoA reductase/sulfur reductase-like enzyme
MRSDKYGGSLENRLRYPIETIIAMRNAVGEDYPIMIRMSADELHGDEGVTLKDTIKHAIPMLEKAGIDCFDITMGTMLHNPQNIPPLYVPRGHYMYLPEAIKKVSSVPVIGVGRILEMEMAEKYIEEGKADIIYLGRQLIADPETPKKYFEGRSNEIRKCIGDLPGFGGCNEVCTVNPTPPNMIACNEVSAPGKKKKILVIGGGVAGMEAARVASLRGHEVILIEKESRLGGNVELLANTSLNYEFRNLVEYLSLQMKKLNVNVRVCKEVVPEDVDTIKPDAVILAAGSTMSIPDIAKGKLSVMTHIDALKNIYTIGKKVVIQGLGYGSELAIELAEKGHEVTVFGKAKEIASNIVPLRRFFILKRLTDIEIAKGDGDLPATNAENPKVLTGTSLLDVTNKDIVMKKDDGQSINIPYDTFIVSMGRKANNGLFEQIKGKASEIHKIGDCNNVGEIVEAMQEAHKIGNSI